MDIMYGNSTGILLWMWCEVRIQTKLSELLQKFTGKWKEECPSEPERTFGTKYLDISIDKDIDKSDKTDPLKRSYHVLLREYNEARAFKLIKTVIVDHTLN